MTSKARMHSYKECHDMHYYIINDMSEYLNMFKMSALLGKLFKLH